MSGVGGNRRRSGRSSILSSGRGEERGGSLPRIDSRMESDFGNKFAGGGVEQVVGAGGDDYGLGGVGKKYYKRGGGSFLK